MLALAALPGAAAGESQRRYPNVVILTVDTLRYDRLSFHGYRRPTSPHIDALLGAGLSFTQARVPEPLTAPSMTSMITGLFPHEHGTSRNGLRSRPGLPSLPKILSRRGYRTAAFIGNWTLKDQLSGLGEHFEDYHEVFTSKRWLGLFSSEADADDLNHGALEWLEDYLDAPGRPPFLLWIHYVEPHAPYVFHKELGKRLGLVVQDEDQVLPSDRYDTEVAFVDRAIGELLAGLEELSPSADTLVVFASDHGESLGEHDYWGHGRHLYDATLRVPMGFRWEGRIEPRSIEAPASLLDISPTILGLLGLPAAPTFRGFDWSPVLAGGELPAARATLHQAHKGAVQRRNNRQARRQGLLEVGRIFEGHKEILRVKSENRRVFDLTRDGAEENSLAARGSAPSEQLLEWLRSVQEGLTSSDELPPTSLDEESIEQLRALGYIE